MASTRLLYLLRVKPRPGDLLAKTTLPSTQVENDLVYSFTISWSDIKRRGPSSGGSNPLAVLLYLCFIKWCLDFSSLFDL